jgi:uncharacterized membrane protein YfcA
MTDLTLWHYLAIAALGVVASIVNILAGGGSNLILPLLMMFGVPPDIANGSNRVGIFFQSLAGIRGFKQADKLPTGDLRGILMPMMLGGLAGSLLASVLPNEVLKPALLLTMLGVAAITFFKPNLLLTPENAEVRKVADTPWAKPLLFAAGVYGGFVQAGAGFLMLPLFAGLLCYDLVRANALKLVCTLSFTTVSLAVFIWYGKIWWLVGGVLAVGNIIGAMIGVRLALKLSPNTMRWILFVMTLVAVAGALWK